MIKSNKNMLLAVAVLCGVIGLTNCSSAPTNTTVTKTENSNTAVVVNTKQANTSGDVVKVEPPAGDKVGVPECDDYIAKYEACLNGKVPEAQRAMFKSSFETMRKSWKEAASTAQGKAAMATGCKQALETAKQSMGAYACAW